MPSSERLQPSVGRSERNYPRPVVEPVEKRKTVGAERGIEAEGQGAQQGEEQRFSQPVTRGEKALGIGALVVAGILQATREVYREIPRKILRVAVPTVLIGGVIAYILWPIDAIPDFIIGFGQADDLAVGVIAGALSLATSILTRPRR